MLRGCPKAQGPLLIFLHLSIYGSIRPSNTGYGCQTRHRAELQRGSPQSQWILAGRGWGEALRRTELLLATKVMLLDHFPVKSFLVSPHP